MALKILLYVSAFNNFVRTFQRQVFIFFKCLTEKQMKPGIPHYN